MNIAIARIKTAQAVALANGDSTAVGLFNAVINELTPYARDPYIMPDVLTPPAPAVDVAAMTKDEVHDAVQAGVITREDAVDAGAIAHVDELSPHPDEVPAEPAATEPVMVPQPEPVVAAPDSPPPPVQPDPLAGNPEQVTENPGSVDAPRDEAAAANQGAVAGSVNQGDSGDEDPTPAEKETIASLDKRLDAIERPGKVSRQ